LDLSEQSLTIRNSGVSADGLELEVPRVLFLS